MDLDRRLSHRFPPPEERSQAVLQVGDHSFRGRLVDQSVTGFAVLVDKHPGVYDGEAVWLRADGVWTKSRVTRVTQDADGVLVGLVRIVEDPHRPEPTMAFQLWRMPSNPRVPLIIALALLITVPGVLWLRSRQRMSSLVDAGAIDAARQLDPQDSIRRLGPELFCHPRVVRHLGLSQSQVDRIRGIAHRHEQSLELARDTGASAEEIRRIWTASQEEARRVLSASQQARWDEALRLLEREEAAAP